MRHQEFACGNQEPASLCRPRRGQRGWAAIPIDPTVIRTSDGGAMRVLIVEDDPLVSRAIAKVVGRTCEAVVVATAFAARKALHDVPDWGAFVFDIGLPDGNGLDVLRYARRFHPKTPAICVTGLPDMMLTGRAYDLGAALIEKPLEPRRLERFLREAMAEEDARKPDPVETAILDWGLRDDFTEKEVNVLRMTVAGETCLKIADTLTMTIPGVKGHWRRIRQKSGDPTIGSAVNRLLHESSQVGRRRS
jgi:DNA-binding NarL/FixJ family response regulator